MSGKPPCALGGKKLPDRPTAGQAGFRGIPGRPFVADVCPKVGETEGSPFGETIGPKLTNLLAKVALEDLLG